jgi:hypothetical protein
LGIASPVTSARTVKGELVAAEDGKLQLTLLSKAPEEGRTLFVDEDIQLSADASRRLGFASATIKAGEYAFSESKATLNVRTRR